jgi:mRNA-degrading endonuclease toxin of MazEF toxin-antitoxin module
MKYSQADIVEVMFPLPNGQQKNHPALIISNRDVYESEGIYYAVMLSTKDYNEVFTLTLTPPDFEYKTTQSSFVKCQLIEQFEDFEIIRRFGKVKISAFRKVLKHLNQSVFSYSPD